MLADVVIIGGGVIGLTAAYVLRQQGAQVVLIDKNNIGQEASWAGAGMLPSFLPDPQLAPIGHMFRESQSSWPQFSRELLELTGINNEYQKCGAITFSPEADLAQSAIIQHDIQLRFPWLKHDQQDIYFHPGYAQVRNPRHLSALKEGCISLGVKILEACSIQQFSMKHDVISHLETSLGKIVGEQFLVSAGAWTAELLRPYGYALPIKPIRGQILLYHWEQTPVNLVIDAGKKYIVPRKDGHLLIGSTEEDVGFIKENTPAGLEELRLFAENLLPALKTLTPIKAWSGLRPHLGSKIPLVGKLPKHQNLWVAAGHFRWGLQLSYETAKLLAQLMHVKETNRLLPEH